MINRILILAIGCCITITASAQTNLLKKLPGKVKKELANMQFINADTLYRESGKTQMAPFYMAKYEVSNCDWRTFESAMISKYGAEKAKQFLPDTTVWTKPNYYNEPFVRYYYRHAAYTNYPVVGINHPKILEYINWKNEEMARVLKQNNVTGYTITFRLPTANEMEFVLQDKYNGGLRTKRGDIAVNYSVQKDPNSVYSGMGIADRNSDNADITAPVSSYWANKLGIHNIRGNVAEWTSTAIQTFAADPKGVQYITKGGSWVDGPNELKQEPYKLMYADSTDSKTGFRLVMDIKPVATAAQK